MDHWFTSRRKFFGGAEIDNGKVKLDVVSPDGIFLKIPYPKTMQLIS